MPHSILNLYIPLKAWINTVMCFRLPRLDGYWMHTWTHYSGLTRTQLWLQHTWSRCQNCMMFTGGKMRDLFT